MKSLTLLLLIAILPSSLHAQSTDPPLVDYTNGNPDLIWNTRLGWTWGAMTLAGDKILLGTSSLPEDKRDQAVLACLSAQDGRVLWQIAHDRLPLRINDVPGSPILSTPAI